LTYNSGVVETTYSFARYLSAKKTIDDRALNAQVWEALARALPAGPLRVLEVGCGIGTMVERALERGLVRRGAYTAVDKEPDNIAVARVRLAPLAARFPEVQLDLRGECALEFSGRPEHRGQYDLVIAHAFLDLLHLPSAVPLFLRTLRPGGLFYFTLNFDGATLFQPEIDPAFDALIESLYHRTMDERVTDGRPSGDSHSGRHLFGELRAAGAHLLAAGSSDWTVFAGPHGYPADEAYFLHFIIHTVGGALRGQPDLDPQRFEGWVAERHAQIERGELAYIAHQMDFCGRVAE
jgi:SAM-dependent methyltransferase